MFQASKSNIFFNYNYFMGCKYKITIVKMLTFYKNNFNIPGFRYINNIYIFDIQSHINNLNLYGNEPGKTF
jgi:hypothetical protein